MRLGGIRLESEDLLELLDGFLDAIPPENTIGPTRLSRSRIDGCDAAACAIVIALGGGVHTTTPARATQRCTSARVLMERVTDLDDWRSFAVVSRQRR